MVPALVIVLLALLAIRPALALTQDTARHMADGDNDTRIAAIAQAASAGDAATLRFLYALSRGEVRITPDRILIVKGSEARDAASGLAVSIEGVATEPRINNRLRREIASAIGLLEIVSEERPVRLSAAQTIAKNPSPDRLPIIDRAIAQERDPEIRSLLELARAAILINAADRNLQLRAIEQLGSDGSASARGLLATRLSTVSADDTALTTALKVAIERIDRRLAWGERLGLAFAGISLGSILLLAAIGLAISYGLMGVINMAHGELIMIGAYATWLVQGLFKTWLPGGFDYYLIAAVPVAFTAAALVGMLMERTVIRFLYGRPLETLLATWGISLVLMQTARTLFGAQNVSVENPAWMSGGIALASNVVLPWNRIIIIAFALAVLVAVALLLTRTRLGLFVRATTQNRAMARCLGVPARRVDTLAFGLGAGLAGLGGCALSQIGNVGPDLGQAYIIDAFMVVVLGGVGQLAGAVSAAIGLGVVNKLIEGVSGPVIAKIAVLLFIVAFIQKRPQGLFALRGRSADA
jgi:urea transport system permease protein